MPGDRHPYRDLFGPLFGPWKRLPVRAADVGSQPRVERYGTLGADPSGRSPEGGVGEQSLTPANGKHPTNRRDGPLRPSARLTAQPSSVFSPLSWVAGTGPAGPLATNSADGPGASLSRAPEPRASRSPRRPTRAPAGAPSPSHANPSWPSLLTGRTTTDTGPLEWYRRRHGPYPWWRRPRRKTTFRRGRYYSTAFPSILRTIFHESRRIFSRAATVSPRRGRSNEQPRA